LNDSVARIAGEARKPKLHTVAEARRISRKATLCGISLQSGQHKCTAAPIRYTVDDVGLIISVGLSGWQ